MAKSISLRDERAKPELPPDAQVEVGQAIESLQSALRDVVESLKPTITRAPDLQRALDIDRNLAWKAHRLVHARSAAEAARFVPGPGGLNILCRSAQLAGVSAKNVKALQQAFSAYETAARRHAGDRASASILLEATVDTPAAGEDLGLRRAAFRAASYACGVRARVHLQTYIVIPSSKPDWIDIIALRGFYDVERLRPEAPFLLTRFHRARTGDLSFRRPSVQPLSPRKGSAIEHHLNGSAPSTNSALLPDFCSQPTPVFREVVREDGDIDEELTNWRVGRTAAVTVVNGVFMPENADNRDQTFRAFHLLGARLRIPCEVLILDVFVERSLVSNQSMEAEVYSELSGDASWFTRRVNGLRVPLHVPVSRLGLGVSAAATPIVPRYPDLLSYAFESGNLNSSNYQGFRVQIDFPLVPTNVLLRRPKFDTTAS